MGAVLNVLKYIKCGWWLLLFNANTLIMTMIDFTFFKKKEKSKMLWIVPCWLVYFVSSIKNVD